MERKHIYLAIAIIGILVCNACASKSKIPLSNFQKIQTVPLFNGTYLNINQRLGNALQLEDPSKPYSWGSYNTDLIDLEYNGKDSLKISFWTENGQIQISYKTKEVENCVEITPKRTRLWIPAMFKDYRYRLRFGFDAHNDLLLHIKEDNSAWFLIIVGGHNFDYDIQHNKVQTMCKDTTLLIPTLVDGKWGYMNCENKIVIDPIYDFARLFDANSVARVKKDGVWGMIDTAGTLITPLKYTQIDPYFDKIDGYKIHIGEDHGYMRASGYEFVLPRYRHVHWSSQAPFYIMRNGKLGFADSTGVVCPAILDKSLSYGWSQPATTDPAYGRLLKVKYQDKKYYLSLDGYLYPYNHKFFREKTTLFDDQRIDVKNISEEDN